MLQFLSHEVSLLHYWENTMWGKRKLFLQDSLHVSNFYAACSAWTSWSSKIKNPRVCKSVIQNGHEVRQAGTGSYRHILGMPNIRI